MKKTPKELALEALTAAMTEYAKHLPDRKKPKAPPQIVPTLSWADPDSFHPGYNMTLSCWTGGMPGMIPVIVVPIHEASHHLRLHTGRP